MNNAEYVLKTFQESENVRNALSLIKNNIRPIKVNSLKGFSFSLFIISSMLFKQQSAILIFPDIEKLQKFNFELSSIVKILNLDNKIKVLSFPDYELWERESVDSFKETRLERINTLSKIYIRELPYKYHPKALDRESQYKSSIEQDSLTRCSSTNRLKLLLATLSSSLRVMVSKEEFTSSSIVLEQNKELNFQSAISKILSIGYEKKPQVNTEGEFAVRGGVLDIFPVGCKLPVRIEFFGNKIEEIRKFSVSDQKSREKVDFASISPAFEVFYGNNDFISNTTPIYPQHSPLLKNKSYFEELIFYSYALHNRTNLIEFARSEKFIIFINEKEECKSKFSSKLAKEKKFLYADKNYSGSDFVELQYEKYRETYDSNLIELSESDYGQDEGNLKTFKFSLPIEGLSPYYGHFETFINSIGRKTGKKIIITKHYAHFKRILTDEVRDIVVFEGALENGFYLKDVSVYFYTDGEIVPGELKKIRKIKIERERIPLKNIYEIKEGDYVVHINHGIGIYRNIQRKKMFDGVEKDYFTIEYAGGDYLYVPIDQMDRIEKYIASDGVLPHVYRLGSASWNRVKERVKKGIEVHAYELFKLYKERVSVEGFPFSPDTVMQEELENSFPYEETQDQLTTIEEIKRDMESKRVMDKIVYGDVGFGKTEIALRAAFKAAMDNKQTALICPTTILAVQHYETFSQRFIPFPAKVDMISRFKNRKEQKETLNKLKKGEIDVIIGTHRLLSKDVIFKDLGLLIIDEEQRFGVRHKEKLKMLKRNIDVVTLTATPIPRTLHMTLIGLRDISRIETPPPDRLSVKTFVKERNEDDIINAVEFELERGGQVYYVHNRIMSIEKEYQFLKQAFPDVSIAVAHGRMPEDGLERTMIKFLKQEIQILLCTAIIENGMDIPSVNTLIVDRCEKFGLADLYQLRGRVGRANLQAYAYFFFSPDKSLTEDAEKRLSALKDFSELGSGYELAMRDLQIRGAGNLLGKQQHGFISDIGFSLYCQMMSNSISQLKGEHILPQQQVQIDLDIPTYIPDYYIKEESEKINIYKRIVSAVSEDEIESIKLEIGDRFGQIPQPIENTFTLCKIKNLAELIGIEKIMSSVGAIEIYPPINIDHTGKLSPFAKGGLRGIFIKKFNDRVRIQANWSTKEDKIGFLYQLLKEKITQPV